MLFYDHLARFPPPPQPKTHTPAPKRKVSRNVYAWVQPTSCRHQQIRPICHCCLGPVLSPNPGPHVTRMRRCTADNITKDIIGLRMDDGMDPGTFRDILYKMIYRRRPLVRNTHEVSTHTYTHTHTHTHEVSTHAHTHAHVLICAHTRILCTMSTHIRHTRTHTYTHTRVRARTESMHTHARTSALSKHTLTLAHLGRTPLSPGSCCLACTRTKHCYLLSQTTRTDTPTHTRPESPEKSLKNCMP